MRVIMLKSQTLVGWNELYKHKKGKINLAERFPPISNYTFKTPQKFLKLLRIY